MPFSVARCFQLIIMHLLMSLRSIPASLSVIWYVAVLTMIYTFGAGLRNDSLLVADVYKQDEVTHRWPSFGQFSQLCCCCSTYLELASYGQSQ